MGLDITAYSELQKAKDVPLDEDDNPVEWMKYFRNHRICLKEYPQHAAGLEPDATYSFAKQISFKAGSYSGYNDWRNELADLAGYGSAKQLWDNPRPGPFSELINFSDCEGVIGPVLAGKLAKDFNDFRAKAEERGSWFWGLYLQWYAAFRLATNNGAVEFH